MSHTGEIAVKIEEFENAVKLAQELYEDAISCDLNTPGRCREEWRRYQAARKRADKLQRELKRTR